MLHQGWILALCLWSPGPLFSVLSATVEPPQGPSPSVRASGHLEDATASSRDSYYWPFWAPTALMEARTSSFLSMPFSLPFDLWGLRATAAAPLSESGAEESRGVTLATERDAERSRGVTLATERDAEKSRGVTLATERDAERSRGVTLATERDAEESRGVTLATERDAEESRGVTLATERDAEKSRGVTLATERDAEESRGVTFRAVGPEEGTGAETTTASDEGAVTGIVRRPAETQTLSATSSPGLPLEDDSPSDRADGDSSLPACRRGACDGLAPWSPAFPDSDGNSTASNQSYDPFLLLAPPMLVPLHSDWNMAMAVWGAAWEVHVYGLGSLFALVALSSTLNLLCLSFCCPPGGVYMALTSLSLLVAGGGRAFSLLYDAYSHQDRLPAAGALLLHEAPFPCIIAAFSLVFLLLTTRSRARRSHSTFHRPGLLAALVFLHLTATFGSVALLLVSVQLPCLILISRGSFVALAGFLSTAYLAFYFCARADATHVYHRDHVGASPPSGQCQGCREWGRAATAVAFSALFALAYMGLQLYALLHGLGLCLWPRVFPPWLWWAFHLSCRICEVAVCLTLALVVTPPLYCSNRVTQAGCCCCGSRSPVQPSKRRAPVWSLCQREKLVTRDAVASGDRETLPLYGHLSAADGPDILCQSNRALASGDTDLRPAENEGGPQTQQDRCSAADLRPPSPLDLRLSIDEALFSEASFPRGLFSISGILCPSHPSLHTVGLSDGLLFRDSPSDRGLFRASSSVEIVAPASPVLPGSGAQEAVPSPSARQRQGSSTSSLYGPSANSPSLSPEGRDLPQSPLSQARLSQREELGSLESVGQLAEQDLAIQAAFVSVCRMIDTFSLCSDTIDL